MNRHFANFTLAVWLVCLSPPVIGASAPAAEKPETPPRPNIVARGTSAHFDRERRAADDVPVGGLVVRLGCADAKALVALRNNEHIIVHGLDCDPRIVERARNEIDAAGIYGPVSVGLFDGKHLPYTDNLVDVLIADAPGEVAESEILRVLVPHGVAHIGEKTIVKRWPDDIDQWTHYLHNASGNPVAEDSRVGPPRHLQWVSGPRWCRSHELDISVPAVVSAGGRIFSVIDQGPTGVHETPLPLDEKRFPDQWALVAQDSFNGLELWRVPIPKWGPRSWEAGRNPYLPSTRDEMWSIPATLPRRLVAVGDRVYVTLGYRAPVSELDAATGAILRRFADGGSADELIICDGVLVARSCTIPDQERPSVQRTPGKAKVRGDRRLKFPDTALTAIDLASGVTLWKKPVGEVVPLSLAASGGSVCFLRVKDELTTLDLRTGDERWRTDVPRPLREFGAMGASLAIAKDKVILAPNGFVGFRR